jgi:hypothetical protein
MPSAASALTMAVAVELAVVEPEALVAVTAARMVELTSVAVSW